MRKRHTEVQIIGILKESEAGTSTGELCQKHGIWAGTYYRWKAKFGGMEATDAKRLRTLENENRRLKQRVADQAVDNVVLKDLVKKKF